MINQKLNLLGISDAWVVSGAQDALAKRDGGLFADAFYSLHVGLEAVQWNSGLLRELGMFETALLGAFTGCKHNNRHWRTSVLDSLFKSADRALLVAAGSPLPSAGPFVLYRGVSGLTSARKIRGLSWTDDIDTAAWFAHRYAGSDPAIYRCEVTADEIYAFVVDRSEREYIVRPRTCVRVKMNANKMCEAACRVHERKQEEQRQWLAHLKR